MRLEVTVVCLVVSSCTTDRSEPDASSGIDGADAGVDGSTEDAAPDARVTRTVRAFGGVEYVLEDDSLVSDVYEFDLASEQVWVADGAGGFKSILAVADGDGI